MVSAPLTELFCSVQGEGPFVGVRQVFVRFARCNLACSYCDTPLGEKSHCRAELAGEQRLLRNPVEAAEVAKAVESFRRVHSVSLTGGEPLLFPEFIREFASLTELPLYLESNMSLPEAALRVRGCVSYVAGDFKLREAVGDAYEELRESTVRCFRVLRHTRRRYTFCKLVLPREFDAGEVVDAVEEVRGYVRMVVLQPVWGGMHSAEILLGLQERLLELAETRIIPQTHKLLGVR
ncbi:MAG: 7-carboxy-7-deazaguanine synthase QueE [Euryarchaeota archaeon]|nr:7-carboxy-7-deazaguanine synthase QueE [Euryarchaeota archaeon]